MDHPEKNVLRRDPGDVQFALPEIRPVFAHDPRWKGSSIGADLFAREGQRIVPQPELPEKPGVGSGF